MAIMIAKPKLRPTRTNFAISQYVGKSLHAEGAFEIHVQQK
jgi:hypothetical protein